MSKQRQAFARDVDDAHQVDFELAAPIVGRELGKRAGHTKASVGDRDIEPAFAFGDRACCGRDIGVVRDVEWQGARAATERFTLEHNLSEPIGTPRRQHQPRTLGGELPRHLGTEPSRCAGDPNSLISKACHGLSLPLRAG